MKNYIVCVACGLILATGILAGDAVAPAETAPKNIAIKSDLVETLKSDGHYKTLLALLDAAGMTAELSGTGEFTLLAPNDDAMAKAGNLDNIKNDPAALRRVLNNHIANGTITWAQMESGKAVTTRGGLAWAVGVGGKRIHDANVVQADISASNGMIQGIDKVLLVEGTVRTKGDEITFKKIERKAERNVKDGADTVYDGVKEGTDKTYDGLKTGTKKIKNFFTGE
ncbi:MAG TPA: fasciclin domain-containing protein [Planctomycetota bacterium]|nr:fasciclin domain-containing protein [Planctomycetota bacterium]